MRPQTRVVRLIGGDVRSIVDEEVGRVVVVAVVTSAGGARVGVGARAAGRRRDGRAGAAGGVGGGAGRVVDGVEGLDGRDVVAGADGLGGRGEGVGERGEGGEGCGQPGCEIVCSVGDGGAGGVGSGGEERLGDVGG